MDGDGESDERVLSAGFGWVVCCMCFAACEVRVAEDISI
jgi:hypothetical protein